MHDIEIPCRDRALRARVVHLLLCGGLIATGLAGQFVCPTSPEPAATLLFPYFAIDLDDPAGRTAMISINNATLEPTLAHVVLWTGWGQPTFAFDLYLAPNAVQTLNLRNFFTDGTLPATGIGQPVDTFFPSCTAPLAPEISDLDLAAVRSLHLGEPNPLDGLCYGDAHEPGLAVGYLTVDVLNDCSAILTAPDQEGYFADGGTGLASNRNAIWGDTYLVDEAGDFAQGLNAYSLVADAGRFGPAGGATFYRQTSLGADNRRPLNIRHRLRFLNGGGFDGGTSVVVWNDGGEAGIGPVPPVGDVCVEPEPPVFVLQELVAHFRGEDGTFAEYFTVPSRRRIFRLEVGGPELPTEAAFGQIDLMVERDFLIGPGNFPDLLQAAPFALLDANGRLSVSIAGTPLTGYCFDP